MRKLTLSVMALAMMVALIGCGEPAKEPAKGSGTGTSGGTGTTMGTGTK